MAYTTVLFDLDYTLFDSDTSQREAIASTIAPLDVDHESAVETFLDINGKLWRDVEAGLITPNDVRTRRFAELFERLGIMADAEALGDRYVEALGSRGGLYPGARRVLEHLADIVDLALITNGIGDVQRQRISRLDLEQYFTSIIISGEVGVAKPGPEIFDIAFDSLARPAKDSTVIVGDSLTSDIAGGHAYGIATCWYNPGEHPANGVRPSHVISKLADLIEIIGHPNSDRRMLS